MFFTQDDYKKIQAWLTKNSVKDTEFNEALMPFNGNETIAFVQDGHNAKASLKDFVAQLLLLGVSDFLNITEKYNESYISLSQAIKLIPFRSRKIGQVITFLNEEGKWKLYQFQGTSILQWNEESIWIDLIQSAASASNIVPDEEDVTGVTQGEATVIKFKDKIYNPDDYSGLGRVYLRKNIVTVEDHESGLEIETNLLSQEMLGKAHTVYIIQYDYNLNGQTITVPEGCVLQFEGGSINNGTITCIKTTFTSTPKFLPKLTIEGTLLNSYISPLWFGGDPLGLIDSTDALQSSINLAKVVKKPIHLEDGTYLTNTLLIDEEVTLLGNRGLATLRANKESIDILQVAQTGNTYVQIANIKGIRFTGPNNFSSNGIRTANTEYLVIEDCLFVNLNRGIIMSEVANTSDIKPSITNCSFRTVNYGILGGATRVADAVISHNLFQNCTIGAVNFQYLDGGDITYNKIFTDGAPVFTEENNGIILTNPIYVKVIGNDIFGCNGYGLQLNNPRRCSFNSNTLVDIGKAANKTALNIINTGTGTKDYCEFIGNKIVNCYGGGISCSNINEFLFFGNEIKGCNRAGLNYIDSITITSCNDLIFNNNIVDGYVSDTVKARYSFNINTSTLTLDSNKVVNHVNDNLYYQGVCNIYYIYNPTNIKVVNDNYNVIAFDDIVKVTELTKGINITLPTTTTYKGKKVSVVRDDSSDYIITVFPYPNTTINGKPLYNINRETKSINFLSTGDEWIVDSIGDTYNEDGTLPEKVIII